MKPTAQTPAYQAVLFDLDGTLLDTAPDFLIALNRLLAAKGRDALGLAPVRAGVSHGSAGLISLAFDLYPGDDDFEPLRQELLGHYQNCLTDSTRLFPGLEVVLAKLATHDIPWGIVTNKPAVYTQAIIDELWLPAAPKTIVCPDHVSRNKPDPEPMLLACRQLGIAPEQTIVIGDHLRDIQSGINAGCFTISAAYGYLGDDEDASDWGGHYLVNHASELDGILFLNQ